MTDGLGSVLAEVKSDGTNAVSYQYDVYGNIINQQGSLYDERQFAGEQADPTGLTYLRARFYDSTTGRFLSRDPKDGWSYGYAGDNPATITDPSGRDNPTPLSPTPYNPANPPPGLIGIPVPGYQPYVYPTAAGPVLINLEVQVYDNGFPVPGDLVPSGALLAAGAEVAQAVSDASYAIANGTLPAPAFPLAQVGYVVQSSPLTNCAGAAGCTVTFRNPSGQVIGDNTYISLATINSINQSPDTHVTPYGIQSHELAHVIFGLGDADLECSWSTLVTCYPRPFGPRCAPTPGQVGFPGGETFPGNYLLCGAS